MLLILGILLWSVTHLFTAVAAPTRTRIVGRIGLNPYKGLFSLAIILSLVLIVQGWKAMPAGQLYTPPFEARYVTMLLMPFAVILFMSARAPTDIKQFIRHPQLTGVKLWALAHLLSNGETRSVILFGGMLAWAVAEVITLNRRDGEWRKPARFGIAKTAVAALIGLVMTAVLVYAHPWLTGMRLLP